MGLFDWLTGSRRPDDGVAVCSAEEVRERLLAVNRDTAPFQVVGGRAEGVDLIAEWKIVDAQWFRDLRQGRAGRSRDRRDVEGDDRCGNYLSPDAWAARPAVPAPVAAQDQAGNHRTGTGEAATG